MQFKPTRDGALFIIGLLGIINEAVLQQVPDPQLLVLFAAMVGLPAFLAKDRQD